MPPIWALGTMWWRGDPLAPDKQQRSGADLVLYDTDILASEQIPATMYLLDRSYGTGAHGWGNFDFSPRLPASTVKTLRDRGYEVMVWIANRAANQFWRDAKARGLLFPNAKEPLWPGIDLRKSEAAAYFADKLQVFPQAGVRAFKIDRGDEGEIPHALVNELAVTVPKISAEVLSRNFGEDYFIMSRNLHDAARQSSAVWSGDPRATSQGLAASLVAGLNAGVIGFPMWGSDAGGFIGAAPSAQLFARWLGVAAFSPLMEVLIDRRGDSLWEYPGVELRQAARKFARIHHELMPYTYSLLMDHRSTGVPVMRPMYLEFPSDQQAVGIVDQYLYGPGLLVAPILSDAVMERSVYLPEGRWIPYEGLMELKDPVPGKQQVHATAAFSELPVYVREGTILVRGDVIQGNQKWKKDWRPRLRVEMFPSRHAEGSFNYYYGANSGVIRARFRESDLIIELPAFPFDTEVRVALAEGDTARRPEGRQIELRKEGRWRIFEGSRGSVVIPNARSVFEAR
jgi:alpha-D-xyloside xylohydrolase